MSSAAVLQHDAPALQAHSKSLGLKSGPISLTQLIAYSLEASFKISQRSIHGIFKWQEIKDLKYICGLLEEVIEAIGEHLVIRARCGEEDFDDAYCYTLTISVVGFQMRISPLDGIKTSSISFLNDAKDLPILSIYLQLWNINLFLLRLYYNSKK
ncbi:hypothetical protein M5K25_006416 [Dendrobium thyrsiflorum]|uniref:Uncharacterized protein n=1 Tax=Dendrobium thyrsiflorum TaxID=117978 RepID=A0ABD0VB30_DENTH